MLKPAIRAIFLDEPQDFACSGLFNVSTLTYSSFFLNVFLASFSMFFLIGLRLLIKHGVKSLQEKPFTS